MSSIPQLQSDINKLQAEKRELQKRVKELEDRGQKVVYRDGPERVVTKRVEVPVEKIVTKRVEVPVEKIVTKRVEVPVEKIVYMDKVKEVPGPVREKTVTVTEYQDNPKTIDRLKNARSDLQDARKQLKEAYESPRIVEVPVERVVTKRIRVKGPVQYVDNPEHIKQIEKLRGMLNAGH